MRERVGAVNDPVTPEMATRFWERVRRGSPSDCWPWYRDDDNNGYGKWRLGGRRVEYAHRAAWRLTYGVIPVGQTVRHACRNRGCCNPRHLRLAGPAGFEGHPRPRGERCRSALLTESDVRAIRARYARGGVTLRELGERYGVTAACVSAVVLRVTWRHVAQAGDDGAVGA